MGQSVTVIEKHLSNPEVMRFEANRSLTGMGHERYYSLDDIIDDRIVDQLARRILEHGGVDSVHVNSSVITVRLAGGSMGEGLAEIVTNLFRFYDDVPVDATDAVAPAEPEPVVETDPAEAPEPEAADAPESAVETEDATAMSADDAPDPDAPDPDAPDPDAPDPDAPTDEAPSDEAPSDDEPSGSETASTEEPDAS